ncbi:hypothetical protein DM860_013325 [Cuscuta australis]|uniref:B box-type domain-containing protein n=1 Tax=Cuscuta australis TaxID=267555 RepID=A0A328DQ22_9ASTE|nr:hypothetical protein DM860_013325 [Cuscuta australis]
MKIQCDVCNKDEASFFCVADDAALCPACDRRVHHANKLAGKHRRFSLLHPPQSPLCDICKEKRGFLFCQQDRAILCTDCDDSVHRSNEHTKKHDRFLLSGVKISAASHLFCSPPPSKSQISSNKAAAAAVSPSPVSRIHHTVAKPAEPNCHGFTGSSSSLSEYLETLPGYGVEELLDSSSPYSICPSKMGDNDGLMMLPFWDGDIERSICTEKEGIWGVPQSSSSSLPFGGFAAAAAAQNGLTMKWTDDNSFAVPQMSPSSTSSFKRPRHHFW